MIYGLKGWMMSKGLEFDGLKDKIVWGVIAGGLSLHFLWAAWITLQISMRPSTAEIERKIVNEAPYAKDRSLILRSLDDNRSATMKFRESIDNNTKAILKLQVFLDKSYPRCQPTLPTPSKEAR